MREIKFRVWDEETSKMYKGNEVIFAFRDELEEVYVIKDKIADELIDYKLMQYTCLKDINGKEIFEGDIVKVENHNSELRNMTGQVIYSEIDASYWVIEGTKENHFGSTISSEFNEYEVIGNIYENRELL
ncbi:MAG: YopX family protein [Peptostreptococcaceae bacterium]